MRPNNTTIVVFANRLSALMHERRVTQVRLADEFQVSQAAVSKWLKGSVPAGVTLVRPGRFFGVTAEELVGLEPPAEQPQKLSRSPSSRKSLRTLLEGQHTADATELNSLFDQLKVRIESDLARCKPGEARARLRMLARLFGAEHSSPKAGEVRLRRK